MVLWLPRTVIFISCFKLVDLKTVVTTLIDARASARGVSTTTANSTVGGDSTAVVHQLTDADVLAVRMLHQYGVFNIPTYP